MGTCRRASQRFHFWQKTKIGKIGLNAFWKWTLQLWNILQLFRSLDALGLWYTKCSLFHLIQASWDSDVTHIVSDQFKLANVEQVYCSYPLGPNPKSARVMICIPGTNPDVCIAGKAEFWHESIITGVDGSVRAQFVSVTTEVSIWRVHSQNTLSQFSRFRESRVFKVRF